ncbi:DUF5518 domain-containing protein [Natronorubrum bangense]|uniref:DUF5518 domain-containing protein n=2 Tax=Natronorubrum bangense TaxID=61858 RepID=L9WII2_9EURY|nr:DUF5518 domain-containing protein [Natronorubrum bangense]ELY49016.1 hypothetical protein C494_09244 [Natronorubrum bangense JCM 10635]QCC54096.1 hypothetical protein DV706_06075 [Natronorubrum bangense]
MTNWRAVIIGFLIATVLGLFGLVLPGLGQLAAGLVGGFVAGYLAGGGLGRGFWHGLLAGALGGIVGGLLVAIVVGLAGWTLGPVGGLISGAAGFGILALAIFISFVMALESAIAGALGGVLNPDRPGRSGRDPYR